MTPAALIMLMASGRVAELLEQLSDYMERSEDGLLKITWQGDVFSFGYRRAISASGVSSVAIPARPSSGTDQKWDVWILQPSTDTRRAVTLALKQKLETWSAALQPTAGGEYHLLAFTPARFFALAPAPLADAVRACWWTYARMERSAAGVAEQLAMDDADLEAVD